MISFSFYIPNDKKVEEIKGRIESPVKISENPLKDFKPKFLEESCNHRISIVNGKNFSFSIAYNK